MPEPALAIVDRAASVPALIAGAETEIGCHTFRATGITDYLTNGRVAQRMAGHSNAKTTGLYDWRADDISVSEVEKVDFEAAPWHTARYSPKKTPPAPANRANSQVRAPYLEGLRPPDGVRESVVFSAHPTVERRVEAVRGKVEKWKGCPSVCIGR